MDPELSAILLLIYSYFTHIFTHNAIYFTSDNNYQYHIIHFTLMTVYKPFTISVEHFCCQ